MFGARCHGILNLQGTRNEPGNELLQDGEVKRECRDAVNTNETEKEGE